MNLATVDTGTAPGPGATEGPTPQSTQESEGLTTEEARTLIHRLGDHFSGIAYAGITMILAAVMIVEGADVVNVTAVDTIETELLNSFTTGAGLVVLLILAIIFGYALSYMEFASMGSGGGGKSSKT